MSRLRQVATVGAALIGLTSVGFVTTSATAGPSTSPSAKMAARLKYHPPKNWMGHYLPDDRYKIGSTWRVLSTELDMFYHRPDCPNMLRQSAGSVIGFASADDALEAGYKPDALCRPEIPAWAKPRPRVAAPDNSSDANGGFNDDPMSDTLTISESQIPKPVRALINLVDGLADEVDNADSDLALLRVKVKIERIRKDFVNGIVARYLGTGANTVSFDDARSMVTILEVLENAADAKGAKNPLGIGAHAYKQLTNSARSSALGLIPGVGEWQGKQAVKLLEQVKRNEIKQTFRASSRPGVN